MSPDPDAELPPFDPATIVDLDVRDDLAAGREPLPRILLAIDALAAGSVLHLRSPFQPAPLCTLLGTRGFLSRSIAFADDDWSTWFWQVETPIPPRESPSHSRSPDLDGILDLRALPPPEPLIAVIERVNASAAAFDVLLPFFPEPLVALLEPARRRVVLVESRPDGVVVRIEAAER